MGLKGLCQSYTSGSNVASRAVTSHTASKKEGKREHTLLGGTIRGAMANKGSRQARGQGSKRPGFQLDNV